MRSMSGLPACALAGVLAELANGSATLDKRVDGRMDPINEMTTRCHHPRDPASALGPFRGFPFVATERASSRPIPDHRKKKTGAQTTICTELPPVYQRVVRRMVSVHSSGKWGEQAV